LEHKHLHLNPVTEYETIKDWVFKLIGKEITPRNLVKVLGKQLNKHHPIRVKLAQTNDLDEGDWCIGAEYDPGLDEAGKKQFIIDFIINHLKTKPLLITEQVAGKLAFDLTEILIHEYEHQRQYRNRRYKQNKNLYKSTHQNIKIKQDQEYLGNPDEIEAYGMNIAARYYLMEYKLNITNEKEIHSPDLETYYKAFGKKHAITKQLQEKIRENIEYYKENDNGKKRKYFKRPR